MMIFIIIKHLIYNIIPLFVISGTKMLHTVGLCVLMVASCISIPAQFEIHPNSKQRNDYKGTYRIQNKNSNFLSSDHTFSLV